MLRNCKYCKFWYEIHIDERSFSYGECRRYPPVQKQSGDVIYQAACDDHVIITSHWEIFTHGANWCGEFKAFK